MCCRRRLLALDESGRSNAQFRQAGTACFTDCFDTVGHGILRPAETGDLYRRASLRQRTANKRWPRGRASSPQFGQGGTGNGQLRLEPLSSLVALALGQMSIAAGLRHVGIRTAGVVCRVAAVEHSRGF